MAGYYFSRVVTLDHTKVPNTDQSSFPALFSGTYAYLATVANGGKVTNASGFDIIFTSDAAGNTKLDHEIDSYDGTTGAVSFWVRIPTLSHTTDTVIYLWYNNPTISTTQENATAVWDSNFAAVYHLRKSGGSLSVADSTSNARNGTNHSGSANTGQIGLGGSFDGISQYSDTSYAPTFTTAQDFTIEGWFNTATGVTGRLLGNIHTNGTILLVEINNWAANQVGLWIRESGSVVSQHVESGATDNDSAWHRFAIKLDHTNHLVKIKVDGRTEVTGGYTPTQSAVCANLFAGAYQNAAGAAASFFNGSIDELRFSTSLRSTDWTDTAYNNESSPSTFYSIGAETLARWIPAMGPEGGLIGLSHLRT